MRRYSASRGQYGGGKRDAQKVTPIRNENSGEARMQFALVIQFWRYLHARTGLTEFPACLLAVDSLRYPGPEAHFFPAMVALVCDAPGKPAHLHRTFITPDGRKAPGQPRWLMSGPLPRGFAVRLSSPTNVLGVADGIETTLSASILYAVPVWSVLSTAGMKSWFPPQGVERLIVFGDNDRNFAGQAAAYAMASRLSSEMAGRGSSSSRAWRGLERRVGADNFADPARGAYDPDTPVAPDRRSASRRMIRLR